LNLCLYLTFFFLSSAGLAFCSSLNAAAEQNDDPVDKGENRPKEGWQLGEAGAMNDKPAPLGLGV
jgi:hypothetical protein